jgi:hypothetical protein
MILPTVHLNGTSRGSLRVQYETAYRVLGDAARALEEAYPNARDYYVQGEDAFGVASREHSARVKAVRDVMQDLEQLYAHVDSVGL